MPRARIVGYHRTLNPGELPSATSPIKTKFKPIARPSLATAPKPKPFSPVQTTPRAKPFSPVTAERPKPTKKQPLKQASNTGTTG